MAQGDFAVRVMQFADDIGLSEQQRRDVTAISKRWRARYRELAEVIVPMGNDVDQLLCRRVVDTDTVHRLARERRAQMEVLEIEYLETWAKVGRLMTDEQFDALFALYADEYTSLPHPVIGSDVREQVSLPL